MAHQSNSVWGVPVAETPAGFKLDAARMWRAFSDLLSPSAAAVAPPLHHRRLRMQTGFSTDFPLTHPAADSTSTTGDGFFSAHAHAMCLVSFLRRLELKEYRRKENKRQQIRTLKPFLQGGAFKRSATSISPMSTSGSDAEATASCNKWNGNAVIGMPTRIKWTGTASKKVQV